MENDRYDDAGIAAKQLRTPEFLENISRASMEQGIIPAANISEISLVLPRCHRPHQVVLTENEKLYYSRCTQSFLTKNMNTSSRRSENQPVFRPLDFEFFAELRSMLFPGRYISLNHP